MAGFFYPNPGGLSPSSSAGTPAALVPACLPGSCLPTPFQRCRPDCGGDRSEGAAWVLTLPAGQEESTAACWRSKGTQKVARLSSRHTPARFHLVVAVAERAVLSA